MNKFAGYWLNALGTKLIGVAVFSAFLLLTTAVIIAGSGAELTPDMENSWESDYALMPQHGNQ